MKIVFDTNVYISGLLFPAGIPSRLLELAKDRAYDLFYSPEIIEEIKRVLLVKFALNLQKIDKLVRFIESFGSVVYPSKTISLVKNDLPDNRILECTLEADAQFLVTGDKKHLIPLKHPYDFKIVTPAQFYQFFLQLNQ